MNNDDICIHCKRTKKEHHEGLEYFYCPYPFPNTVFKSISQHYAELRGPENLKVMEEVAERLQLMTVQSSTEFLFKESARLF